MIKDDDKMIKDDDEMREKILQQKYYYKNLQYDVLWCDITKMIKDDDKMRKDDNEMRVKLQQNVDSCQITCDGTFLAYSTCNDYQC